MFSTMAVDEIFGDYIMGFEEVAEKVYTACRDIVKQCSRIYQISFDI